MANPTTTLSPRATRQLAMLAEALIGVAEEEILVASLEAAGQATARVTGNPTPADSPAASSGGGNTALWPIEGRAPSAPSGFSEPRLPSARGERLSPPPAPGSPKLAGSRRTVGLRPTEPKEPSPEFLPRPLLPGSEELGDRS
jgi:hypothetical protein